MNEAMQKLVEAIQKASPEVWRAAYRQVFINGLENLLLMIFFIGLAVFFWKWRERVLEKDDDAGEPGPIILAVAVIASAILTLPFLVCGLDCFANPTFAAIKELKGLI